MAHADELVLSVGRRLIMQPAHRAHGSADRLVVLHEIEIDPKPLERGPVPGLAEAAPRIAEDPRRQDQDTRQFRFFQSAPEIPLSLCCLE